MFDLHGGIWWLKFRHWWVLLLLWLRSYYFHVRDIANQRVANLGPTQSRNITAIGTLDCLLTSWEKHETYRFSSWFESVFWQRVGMVQRKVTEEEMVFFSAEVQTAEESVKTNHPAPQVVWETVWRSIDLDLLDILGAQKTQKAFKSASVRMTTALGILVELWSKTSGWLHQANQIDPYSLDPWKLNRSLLFNCCKNVLTRRMPRS